MSTLADCLTAVQYISNCILNIALYKLPEIIQKHTKKIISEKIKGNWQKTSNIKVTNKNNFSFLMKFVHTWNSDHKIQMFCHEKIYNYHIKYHKMWIIIKLHKKARAHRASWIYFWLLLINKYAEKFIWSNLFLCFANIMR